MSVDFTIVCKRPKPADWGADLPLDDLPFAVFVRPFEAWRADILEDLAEREAEGEELDVYALELKRRVAEGGSFVLGLNCRPVSAELVDLCAQEAIQRFGGFYYDDHSEELSPVLPGSGAASARDLLAAWRTLIADGALREARIADQSKREWEAAAAKDPESFDKDNDWSDL